MGVSVFPQGISFAKMLHKQGLRQYSLNVLALFLATLALVITPVSHPIFAGSPRQGIAGKITIWYWATACRLITGENLQVAPADGRILIINLTWSITYSVPITDLRTGSTVNYKVGPPGCASFSSFRVDLDPGTYSVTLSPMIQCEKPQPGAFGGITCNFPLTVNVEPGVYSSVVLGVSGGI